MIHIVYEPLLAGNLIAQIISMFSMNKEQNFDLYDENDKEFWTQREAKFTLDPNIEFVKGHHYRFKHFLNYDNMIFCSCNTQKEKNLLEKRVAHVKHGIMNNPYLIDIRVFYLQELYDYLIRSKKDFYNMPYEDVWDTKKFPTTMINCLKWLNLPYDEEKIKYAQKKWIKSNIVRRSKLTDKERKAYYEYRDRHTHERESQIRRARSV
jgi:hypothetical protein